MNRSRTIPILFLCGALLAATNVLGQSGAKDKSTSEIDRRPAQVLFEEANSYLGRKYAEFNKEKLPYDPKLEEKTRKEQRELATRNAAILLVRKPLAAEDQYYLGMLEHLMGDSDAALETMRLFLKNDPDGDKSQTARSIVILYATKKNLIPEAEAAVVAYLQHQPQNLEDRYKMELLIVDALFRAKEYVRMATHAKEMLNAAKSFAAAHKSDVFKRDEMLLKSTLLIAEAYARSDKKETAVSALEDLRQLAISLPSGNLYKLANIRLTSLDPALDLGKLWNESSSARQTAIPPEIVATQWIDQEPKKLTDLRGQVVLLDFWAPWCGPCRYTLPKIERWHETYKNKGLVILGLTNYTGEVDGRKLTPGEELAYLREFKKRNRLSYGFAVADSHLNDYNYGVFSIPMSFLIDRRGVLRFISAGAEEPELEALGKMIKKLLEEPLNNTTDTETKAGAGATKK